MNRNYGDWLTAFCDYASYGEAPRKMHFWTGVSAIAGALRRRVWIDQTYFQWTPNFYIILVAPPGIVSKSTTASVGMKLLRRVPGVKFGPDVVTWQALVTAFSEATEMFDLGQGEFQSMSAITIESSEFGNLLDPSNRDMVDLLVNLWDSKQGTFEKRTKMSGNDSVVNPWINLIACTTPSWIASNFPEYMVGGGFTSRCVFVYASEKAKYVAYPGNVTPPDIKQTEDRLVQDLEAISMLSGQYRLSDAATVWGEAWYLNHYQNRPPGLDDERFGGYIARKQTHIHKLAMVLAASRTCNLTIEPIDLITSNEMVTDLEKDMPSVFSKIGRSDVSLQGERLLSFVQRRGAVPYEEAYRFIHAYFPSMKEYVDMLEGLVRAGYIRLEGRGPGASQIWLVLAKVT